MNEQVTEMETTVRLREISELEQQIRSLMTPLPQGTSARVEAALQRARRALRETSGELDLLRPQYIKSATNAEVTPEEITRAVTQRVTLQVFHADNTSQITFVAPANTNHIAATPSPLSIERNADEVTVTWPQAVFGTVEAQSVTYAPGNAVVELKIPSTLKGLQWNSDAPKVEQFIGGQWVESEVLLGGPLRIVLGTGLPTRRKVKTVQSITDGKTLRTLFPPIETPVEIFSGQVLDFIPKSYRVVDSSTGLDLSAEVRELSNGKHVLTFSGASKGVFFASYQPPEGLLVDEDLHRVGRRISKAVQVPANVSLIKTGAFPSLVSVIPSPTARLLQISVWEVLDEDDQHAEVMDITSNHQHLDDEAVSVQASFLTRLVPDLKQITQIDVGTLTEAGLHEITLPLHTVNVSCPSLSLIESTPTVHGEARLLSDRLQVMVSSSLEVGVLTALHLAGNEGDYVLDHGTLSCIASALGPATVFIERRRGSYTRAIPALPTSSPTPNTRLVEREEVEQGDASRASQRCTFLYASLRTP